MGFIKKHRKSCKIARVTMPICAGLFQLSFMGSTDTAHKENKIIFKILTNAKLWL
jgi:hypothetical protein